MPDLPKPKTRWLRFGLRTLLGAMTLAAVGLGWWTHRAKQQHAAVAAIRAYGGWCYYDYELPNREFDPEAQSRLPAWLVVGLGRDYFHNVVEVNLGYRDHIGRSENANLTADALVHLPGLPNVRRLLLHKTQASNSGLAYVGQLRRLEDLYMWDAWEVTDEGLAHLSRLKRLKYLHCSNSHIGDNSLAVLARLPRLKGLSLQGNFFSDAGLAHLANMRQLETLCVGIPRGVADVDRPYRDRLSRRDPITDAGLVHLQKLDQLELLDLQHTHVTSDGLKHLTDLPKLKELWISGSWVKDLTEFKAAKPGCSICGP